MHCPLRIDPSEIQLTDYSAIRGRIDGASVAYRERKAREDMAKFVAEQERQRHAAELLETLAQYREIKCNTGPRGIILEIAAKHGVDAKYITGVSRLHKVTVARFEAMYEIRRRLPDYSLPRIGKVFGNRDHTTVLNACRVHAKRNNLPMLVAP